MGSFRAGTLPHEGAPLARWCKHHRRSQERREGMPVGLHALLGTPVLLAAPGSNCAVSLKWMDTMGDVPLSGGTSRRENRHHTARIMLKRVPQNATKKFGK